MTARAAAIWSNRSAVALLVRRDLVVKYQQSILGYLWSLAEPLSLAAIYWFVFGVLFDTRIGLQDNSYPLFLVSGIFAWMWCNAALNDAVTALTSQARLIKTMRLPREIFPISRVIGRFAEYAAGFPVIVLFAVLYGVDFGPQLLNLLLALIAQGLLLFGLSFLLSSINVLLRDVERIMRLILRALFYAAPIIYPIHKVTASSLPDWLKILYQCNPLVGIIQLHHSAWYPTEFPPMPMLLVTLGGCVLAFVSGWAVFRRLEPAVLKEL